jgi:hypothetical protein
MEVIGYLHAPADLPASKKLLPMKSRLISPQSGSGNFKEERIPARISTPERPAHSLVTILSTLFPTPHSHTENGYSRPNAC